MTSKQIDTATGRRGAGLWLAVLALALGLALGAAGGRYWFKAQALSRYDALKQQLEGDLVSARAQLAESQARVDALTGNLMVEESTRKGLETTLARVQADLGQANEKLAFFHQLFPPGPAGAVSVRALTMEWQGANLSYRALFMRNALQAPTFQGRIQFVAKGSRDGKPASAVLLPAQGAPQNQAVDSDAKDEPAEDGTDAFTLHFDEFQRSAGLLAVPDGFTPESVTLNVLEGDTLRVSRSIKLDPAPTP